MPKLSDVLKQLSGHSGFRRYFSNMSWLFAENTLRLVAGLLVGVYVARYLGPSQFGGLSYAISFAGLFGAISDLGLEGIVVRNLVAFPEKRDLYLGTAFWLKLTGSFIMLGVIAIAIQFTSNDHATNLYIFIIASGLIFQSCQVVDFYFQSKVLSKYVSICKMSQLLLSSIVKLFLVFLNATLIWFVLVMLVDCVLLSVSLFVAYRSQRFGLFFAHFDLKTAKEMLADSWPLVFSGLTVMVYLRIDQIMIKEMLGASELGLYSAAVKLSEIWYFLPGIITTSLFPAIINAKKSSSDLYARRLQRLYSLMVWLALFIALPVSLASEWVIKSLYGIAFVQAAGVLKIYIWGGVFVFLSAAFGKYLIAENLTRKNLYRVAFGAIISVPLNYVLIRAYGIRGAAIASLISLFGANYAYDLFDRELWGQLKLKTFAFVNPISLKL